ncbi:uncharacterized protein CC84DRAFT_1221282 [Paraphaeosphaeria sporulosa]|uniref:Uncharacterized protein n=1 Tax=Paraphaeosphaeria sporulosa TaxID=1460663 RepID=A0A177C2E0_9PLEO|nr:uncharacterized protein CC84DRAFT_1221282 [Paraphaeosphaeria sporulosa]OAG01813.1 hypothetical protein CC84DRAFT_1221282 [Paraphaeosphaeria sporulosa]
MPGGGSGGARLLASGWDQGAGADKEHIQPALLASWLPPSTAASSPLPGLAGVPRQPPSTRPRPVFLSLDGLRHTNDTEGDGSQRTAATTPRETDSLSSPPRQPPFLAVQLPSRRPPSTIALPARSSQPVRRPQRVDEQTRPPTGPADLLRSHLAIAS